MTAKFGFRNTVNCCARAAVCPSVDIIPLLDAAVLLVVSIVVCLRVIMLPA